MTIRLNPVLQNGTFVQLQGDTVLCQGDDDQAYLFSLTAVSDLIEEYQEQDTDEDWREVVEMILFNMCPRFCITDDMPGAALIGAWKRNGKYAKKAVAKAKSMAWSSAIDAMLERNRAAK